MNLNFKHIFSSLLICAIGLSWFSSCSEDELLLDEATSPGSPDFGDNVYSLGFTVTLDDMGTRSGNVNGDPYQVTRWENYINLERFRVLFFDKDDLFLFESKNRWVKQTEGGDSFSSWFVSVPLGSHGNDSYGEGEEYDWDLIRNILTNENFKIVIMANRPSQLLYPGNFMDSELKLPGGVFDNDGPYWGPENFRKKKLFDLQHYQYDIIYADKGSHASTAYYDFIMGEIDTDRPTMGAAINWVSFDNNDNDKVALGSGGKYMRNIKMPSEDHPIPMYGVQSYPPIPPSSWQKGTTFDLSVEPSGVYPETPYSGRKAISLLRCCVRLDLKIPKSVMNGKQPTHVSLWYSNIYSRTEPIDNWTPTNELWNHNGLPHSDANCEMQTLIDHGNVINSTSITSSKTNYQNCIKWFYTAWLEKGWPFNTKGGGSNPPSSSSNYPRIMNSCIQRNQFITLQNGNYTNYFQDNNQYWHYVVYTGERNPNDANTFDNLPKNPYVAFFAISWDNSKFYMIPLMNYEKNTDTTNLNNVFGPHTDGSIGNASAPSTYNSWITNTVPTLKGNNIPYPLLRNHIYTFTLTGKSRAGDEELTLSDITSDVRATENINFSKQLKSIHSPLQPSQTPSTSVNRQPK